MPASSSLTECGRLALRASRASRRIAATWPKSHRRFAMPMYLGRFNYTPEAVKSMVENPQDRSVAAREATESLGGKLHGIWFAFGEWDGYSLLEGSDNAGAAAR